MWPIWQISLVAGVSALGVAIIGSTLTYIYLHKTIAQLKGKLHLHGVEARSAIRVPMLSTIDEEQAQVNPDPTDLNRRSLPSKHRIQSMNIIGGRKSWMYDKSWMVSDERICEVEGEVHRFRLPNRQKSQKEHKTPNKLRRSIPIKSYTLSSPLSAISERSSSPVASPSPGGGSGSATTTPTRTLFHVLSEQMPWPLAVAKTRRERSSSNPINALQLVTAPLERQYVSADAYRRSISTSTAAIQRTSIGKQPVALGMQSRHESAHTPLSKSMTEEDQHEAWKDFDFDLKPPSTAARYGSLATSTQRSHADLPDTVGRDETKTDGQYESSHISAIWPGQLAKKRANSPMTGPPGRHSMFVGGQPLRGASTASQSDQQSVAHARSVSANHVQEASSTDHLVRDDFERPPPIPNRARQHRRKNAVRISGLPMLSLTTAGLGSSSPPKVSPIHPGTWSRAVSPSKQRESDIFCDGAPATPCDKLHMSDDEESEQLRQQSTPHDHYDSPTLPPPAYTSAGLYPRRTQLHGPRDYRPTIPSPTARVHFKKQRPSIDLRKSIMMLRSMNSEELLSLKGHSRAYRSLGGSGGGNSSNPSQRSSLSDVGRSTSARSIHSSTPAAGLPISDSVMSIWEDESFVSDSPDLESSSWRDPSSRSHRSYNSHQSSILTPNTKSSHFGESENHPHTVPFDDSDDGIVINSEISMKGLNVGIVEDGQLWNTQ